MEITRKLDDIHRSLPESQGNIMEFLTNAENAQKINGLVGDIHEALIDYQVCMSITFILLYLKSTPDFTATRYLQQELSTHCGSCPLTFHPRG